MKDLMDVNTMDTTKAEAQFNALPPVAPLAMPRQVLVPTQRSLRETLAEWAQMALRFGKHISGARS
ncbi:hypothetical protein [Ketogulonicigenium vulgare]|uniref:Uncharacterized protein n=1 Tax=Ketogulonicigenium vulgare (strain WSH-001) TaxID=759362 RepID=F9Y8C5_KETVW|nr:hypothetical protein [Ketogulonicigenium vulgare]ADO41412.1 hypothetical protein EIO_0226 [Ketogulonicigenium vulgare Y25]AEM42411.1 hypothetical protein KVU_2572 [Ketogulonicigenium vulgare WSH-001]ALJ82211.1 hypothetical protein KVH_01820 [Ketogulonicigenium vulgare]ANW34858.1 hypothetical protein KvSKV_01820 [Ketogulonicigenium vulgare]AOZ53496.1 hypothetical protein KVC_0470 [Ketogulonicigenium vulgare]